MTYLRLGLAAVILIIILGLASAMFMYRGNAISAHAEAAQARVDLQTAQAVNKNNEAVMARLKADRDASDKLAAALENEISVANESALDVARALADLRMKNADVDSYMRQPVPAALRSMLDHSKTLGGH